VLVANPQVPSNPLDLVPLRVPFAFLEVVVVAVAAAVAAAVAVAAVVVAVAVAAVVVAVAAVVVALARSFEGPIRFLGSSSSSTSLFSFSLSSPDNRFFSVAHYHD